MFVAFPPLAVGSPAAAWPLAPRIVAAKPRLGLRQAGLYTELDRDVLGQFLVARDRWVRADKLASAAIRNKDEKLAKEWTGIQSTYFKQCRQCAEAMGLSVSSRCRLVVPDALVNAAKDDGEEDERYDYRGGVGREPLKH